MAAVFPALRIDHARFHARFQLLNHILQAFLCALSIPTPSYQAEIRLVMGQYVVSSATQSLLRQRPRYPTMSRITAITAERLGLSRTEVTLQAEYQGDIKKVRQ